MSKLQDELKIVKVITTYRSPWAFQCEALFKEVNEELEIIGIELAQLLQ
jgi:hypothetical protein